MGRAGTLKGYMVEVILILIFGFSWIAKYMVWSFGGDLTVISMMALFFYYMFGGVFILNKIPLSKIFSRASYAGLSKKRILGTIGLGLALGFLVSGILFVSQSWVFGKLLIGKVTPVVLFGALLVFLLSNDKVFKQQVTIRCLFWIIVAGGIYTIPYDDMLDLNYAACPEMAEVKKKLYRDPGNPQLLYEVDVLNHECYGREKPIPPTMKEILPDYKPDTTETGDTRI